MLSARVAAHRLAAALAEQRRGARKQQLQVIVELGHRADGRARGAHRIGLVDGDRRRNAVDAIDLRLVHAVEELPRVRREGLDVAALAFGVQRVEHERRLARARHAGDDDQLVQRDLEVEILEIVLARATQRNGVTGGVGHSVTVFCQAVEHACARSAQACKLYVDPSCGAASATRTRARLWGSLRRSAIQYRELPVYCIAACTRARRRGFVWTPRHLRVSAPRQHHFAGARRTIRGVSTIPYEETANEFQNASECRPGRRRRDDVLHRRNQHRQRR